MSSPSLRSSSSGNIGKTSAAGWILIRSRHDFFSAIRGFLKKICSREAGSLQPPASCGHRVSACSSLCPWPQCVFTPYMCSYVPHMTPILCHCHCHEHDMRPNDTTKTRPRRASTAPSQQTLHGNQCVNPQEVLGILASLVVLGRGGPSDLLRHPVSDLDPESLALKNRGRI